ncbi:MAG: two-component sensor histidine kinase [Proteobacteria bacterium]|nr:two-component sensor histidine kinase [Pseudomonadota bacterium]MBU1710158.1 two-component sensor histidine kinase [Pseudomonadota bacterium]
MKSPWLRLIRFTQNQFVFCINDSNLSAQQRYLYLRRGLLLILCMVAMIPLIITAGLSYNQYRQVVKEEVESNARWSTVSTKQNIETFLGKLRSSISIIADAYSFMDLTQQNTLDLVFEKLKHENPGVVDLSVIGPDGVQQTYSGPFNLTGKNYAESLWYSKTLAQQSYISEVFLGFRNLPHFVVAVSRKISTDNSHWILRASIDTETIDRFLLSIHSDIVEDVFLVNSAGLLQSSSSFYGKVGAQSPLTKIPRKNRLNLVEEYRNSKPIIRTYSPIKDTPWTLVLEHTQYAEKKPWRQFKRKLLIILCVCSLLIVIAAYRIAGFVAASIRSADEAREALLAQTEHNDKLASIGRLAAGVAHEINNPLAIIHAKAQLLKDLLALTKDFEYREKFLAQLDSQQKAVARSRDITHRLLGFARRMESKLEPVWINMVIEEVLSFLEREAQYKSVRIDLDLQQDLPAITSDQGQLQQILFNIINNAIDSVDKNSSIEIRTKKVEPAAIRIEISDHGPGMSPEIQKKIFEPFFTTKNEKDKQGTGLGLFITYGLVKKLHGDIQVQSVVGIGTTFILSFPEQRQD